MPELPGWLEAEIDGIWHTEQIRLNGQLFNGQVFSADIITPQSISGHWTEFRRIVAQMRRPHLYAFLGIRSLAICGLITCPDGVIFGRRPENSVYQSGQWQLPPAGSVDPSCVRSDGSIDFSAMLFTELQEELGLDQAVMSAPQPIGIIEHADSHVLDFGLALHTQLSTCELLRTHATLGNGEYDPVVIIPEHSLEIFLTQPNVTFQTPMLLRAFGLIACNLQSHGVRQRQSGQISR